MSSEVVKMPDGSPMDKIKRYKWTLKDSPGNLKWIDKKLLEVDQSYQRAHITAKVQELASKWSWVACGAIITGFRNDRYFVIDGQHRVLAAKNRSDIIDLPCIVFETVSIVEEARGFLNANINRKTMRIMDSYRAKLIAKDEDALYLQKLLKDMGMHLTTHNDSPLGVSCVGSCFTLMKSNRLKFEETMNLLKDLCKEDVVDKKILQGFFYLSTNLNTDFNNKRLRDRILLLGIAKLSKAAKDNGIYTGAGGGKVWAIGMLEEINKGLRIKFQFKEA